jgi:hypothetical protein
MVESLKMPMTPVEFEALLRGICSAGVEAVTDLAVESDDETTDPAIKEAMAMHAAAEFALAMFTSTRPTGRYIPKLDAATSAAALVDRYTDDKTPMKNWFGYWEEEN